MIFLFIGLVMLSIVVLVLSGIQDHDYQLLTISAIFLVPLLAVALVFPILRKRLPGIELRANQALVGILYIIMVVLVTLSANTLVGMVPFETEMARGTVVLVLVIAGCLLSAHLYPRFREEVHHRLLGIPRQSFWLSHVVANNIVNGLTIERLAAVLSEKVQPALMVRQGALVGLDEKGNVIPLLLYGVEAADLPTPQELMRLLENSGRYRPVPDEGQAMECRWVRLALPLRIEDRTIGACLMGRRDPDDFYSVEELPTLRAITDQLALALWNIQQNRRLLTFHHSNIQRYEQQQAALARDLHDDVLNQMAMVTMNAQHTDLPESFYEQYQKIINHVRNIVNGLRTPLIEYGLQYALNDLVDELSEQSPGHTMRLEVNGNEAAGYRYPQVVEIHLYRIVQEACRNSLKHAPNSQLTLGLFLAAEQVELWVLDNGPGFDASGALDFNYLLAHRHFGLANMYERAQIIGAQLSIHSAPGQGAEVRVLWKTPAA